MMRRSRFRIVVSFLLALLTTGTRVSCFTTLGSTTRRGGEISLFASARNETPRSASEDARAEPTTDRRSFLARTVAAASFVVDGGGGGGIGGSVRAAVAEDGTSLVSAEELARRLRVVPTFVVVDREGVPFAVVGEDARLSVYFFTTYDEARRILTVARKSADKSRTAAVREENAKRRRGAAAPLSAEEIEREFGINPWNGARISTVPLDFAVTLAFVASGRKTGSYFYVQPAEDDVADALALDASGKKELPEGSCPLFYVDEDVDDGSDSTKKTTANTTTPVYFRKSQLVREWRTRNKGKVLPDVRVTELGALVREMVRPGGADAGLSTVVFVPPPDSERNAESCRKAGGDKEPFKLGERIVVL